MAKYELLYELFESATKSVFKDEYRWTDFLNTQAITYKYNFKDSILIYEQKSDVTACASFDIWNRLGRTVKRNEKGIALLDENNKTKYIWDVSSTVGEEETLPRLWEFHNNQSFIQDLYNEFGIIKKENSLHETFAEAISDKIKIDFEETFSELVQEDNEIEKIKNEYFANLIESVKYCVFKRCNMEYIPQYNNISVLGNSHFGYNFGQNVNHYTKSILKEIENIARRYENEHEQERDSGNRGKRYSVREGGTRVVSTQLRTSRRESHFTGEIRDASQRLFEEVKAHDVRQTLPDGQLTEPLQRSGGVRRRTTRIDNGATGETVHKARQQGFHGDSAVQLHDKRYSGGDSTKRDSVQLQLSIFDLVNKETQAVDENSAVFSFSKTIENKIESSYNAVLTSYNNAISTNYSNAMVSVSQNVVDEVLCLGSNKDKSKSRICSYFKKTKNDNVDFIKKEYITYFNKPFYSGKGIIFENEKYSVWFNENGINIAKGDTAKVPSAYTVSWNEATKRIEELLIEGKYLSQLELDFVDDDELKYISEYLWHIWRDDFSRLPEGINSGFTEGTEDFYDLIKKNGKLDKVITEYEFELNKHKKGRWHDIHGFLKELKDLKLPKTEFVSKNVTSDLKHETFITNDEIESLIQKGSSFENGKYRIFEYFLKEKSIKARTDFLKNAYGMGGSSPGLLGVEKTFEKHNGKGIYFSRGSILFPDSKVLINWNQVAKEIDRLINDNNYLTSEEKEKYNEHIAYKQQKDIAINSIDTISESLESITPDLPKVNNAGDETVDYSITDLNIASGAKSKFKDNITAIRLLKELEENNKTVTKKHQEVLAKYVGWGAIPQAFDENNGKWSKEYTELKDFLSEDEYKQARASVLNAHYTSPVVIDAIYSKLNDFGFEKGRILEPAMGVGNFFGMLPQNMKESSLYGVELDSITGRIAKKLYPKANIKVCGFEKTHFNNNSFDVAIGNVPFGNYGVNDKEYNYKNYKIHDYFFVKSLDKVRQGGIVAFITSTGTLDKQSTHFRQELARKAELLGAVRLPNNAFFNNAGTKVTTDIIFLQKREMELENTPNWITIGETAEGIPINNYYVNNPQMLLGTMAYGSLYGSKNKNTELLPLENADLKQQLKTAMAHIKGQIKEQNIINEVESEVVDAKDFISSGVRNYSFVILQEEPYFYKNGTLEKAKGTEKQAKLICDLINIRDCLREIIKLQTDHTVSDEQISTAQKRLNALYDSFILKNGCRITSVQCSKAFKQDSSYPLLRSIEELNEDKEFLKKAPIFFERTIVPHKPVQHCDTSTEALSVSMQQKAKVDIEFIAKLTNFPIERIIKDLQKEIFMEPLSERWVIADEYLSGNVREKLRVAEIAAEQDSKYNINVEALLRNQPKDLEASEIFVRLGSTWIPTDDIKCFVEELLELSFWQRKSLKVNYSQYTDVWGITGKINNGALSKEKYGTQRKCACEIIEESLNLKDSRVYDTIEQDGKEKRVINQKETMLAQEKQAIIENEFKNWIFKDQDRRDRLVTYYNKNFNCITTRKYDGSNIKLHDVNPEIQLRPHQNNAIARGLYGGNKLLAHVVGAGKSFTMAAISQEKLKVGLSNKCMFAVPKHLTEQMASEILRLYPAANVLVATTEDFSSAKRKEFCAKIATGGYNTIIIAHSQLEKIPLSKEFQENVINTQLNEIKKGIIELKNAQAERFSIKQMEKMRKNLEIKLEKLTDLSEKDDVINFEELGIDDLYIDEAHEFKNLMYITKMRNVGGLSNTSSKKAQDLYMKCSYINEKTNFKGLTFATGTPISNSIAELYTMQRYLQPQDLSGFGISHFDSWVSSFAQTKTALELNPTGQGYRMKTRLSNYHNLPELMTLFSNVADAQTQEMLNLPVPKLKNNKVTTVVLKPTEMQKEIVKGFGKRAEKIHNKSVVPEEDNFLKITNEGRLLALDQRLINQDLEDEENSKISVAANNIYNIWEDTKVSQLTQLVFSDIGTPKENEQFDVYNDLKKKLELRGIPKEEIAFIHSAKTDEQKAALFSKVRKGKVRVLIGSTFKMGSGTNIQDKLIALHHLDVPWRPSDLEQREGRILRQGNTNQEVEIFRYATEGTFDAYNYQIIESKQKFISQVMTNNSPARSMEEIDDKTLNYAEIKALATGNPKIKEKMELDVRIAVLQQLKASYNNSKYRYESAIKNLPVTISSLKEKIAEFKKDLELAQKTKEREFLIEFDNYGKHDKRVEAGELIYSIKKQVASTQLKQIAKIRGFKLYITYDTWNNKHKLILKNNMQYSFEVSDSPMGTITRIENALEGINKHIEQQEMTLQNTLKEFSLAEQEISQPFEHEDELKNSIIQVTKLNAELSLDKAEEEREGVVAETEIEETDDVIQR